jgi:hypothetical protein
MNLRFHIPLLILAVAFPLATKSWDLTNGIEEVVPKQDVPSFFQILVVSADNLNDPPYTKANPPRGVFTVHECIRGYRGYVKNDKVELGWEATSNEKDHVPWSKDMPELWQRFYEERPGTREWQETQLPAPSLGQQIIVFAVPMPRPLSDTAKRLTGAAHDQEIWKDIRASRKMTYLEVRAAFALNATNRQTLVEYGGRTDRDPRIQVPLMLLLPGCSPLWVALFGLGFALPPQRRWRVWVPAILIAPSSILLWLLYESGNVTGGIRIDLLIILPALALNTVGAIVTAVFLLVNRSRVRKGRANQVSEATARRLAEPQD